MMRTFPVAVSAGDGAGAWARQENAPAGSTVVVEREISALGRIGKAWEVPPEQSLAFATVLRPPLTPDVADACWLVASMGVITGAASVVSAELSAWWPDRVVNVATGATVATTKVEVQLGPAEVRAAIAIVRVDLAGLGLEEPDRRDELLEAVLGATDEVAAGLADGTEPVASAYTESCCLVGKRVKLRLLPTGEKRGTPRGVDRGGGLELTSTTGMVERISVDMLRELVVV
jgi:biotin-(acetyl-CoA carboxylase) ligase